MIRQDILVQFFNNGIIRRIKPESYHEINAGDYLADRPDRNILEEITIVLNPGKAMEFY